MYNPQDPRSLEKYSSAVTLSDMEVFIFPEILYSLLLANMMSPVIWKWLENPWFKKSMNQSPYRKIQRTKQFIIDNFTFNLDLDTWGLTTKDQELARFKGIIDEKILAQSNALFGYEGDRYYFDIDIRKHFGLDKYTSEVIPYWKTETAEAMEAFRFKPGYTTGAGECVSLSALYAAAIRITAGISLKDIYMMATPLHSQNFIDVADGVLTNNRRIVTKNMWFNGSEISEKARRAIVNEKITIVMNSGTYIHTMYDTATIDPDMYNKFSSRLTGYLSTDINFSILSCFLRSRSKLQKCFQIIHDCCGKPRYIEAEKVYAYEHGSKARVGDETQSALLHEIDEDEFYASPIDGRMVLSEFESFFLNNHISVNDSLKIEQLKSQLRCKCVNVDDVISDLIKFAKTEPRLPHTDKNWKPGKPINLDSCTNREDVIAELESLRDKNETADLAFTAFRDMSRSPWKPFMKAALKRNPVCVAASVGMDETAVFEKLKSLPDQSIYEGPRMAQPDEVWNFGRGDGLEKAVCLLDILRNRFPQDTILIKGDRNRVCVTHAMREYSFDTMKNLVPPQEEDCKPM
jgi:hypothetical protein